MPLPRRFVRHFGLACDTGVRIQSLESDSPAIAAGIARDDIVVGIDSAPIANIDDLQRALGADAIGRELGVVVLRRDRKVALAAVPRERASGEGKRSRR